MKIIPCEIIILTLLFIMLVNPASAYNSCGSPVTGSPKSFVDVPINTEQTFAGYHITYTGNDGDYSVTYFISGNEFAPSNYYTIYSADIFGVLYWNPLYSLDGNGKLIFELDTKNLNVGSSLVTFDIQAYDCVNSTPTPTPTGTVTPIPTIPVVVTSTPTTTTTGAPGSGNYSYTSYNSSDASGTYSHIPSKAAGFNDLLKGTGYCKSGTCTGTDIKDYVAANVNIFWWLSFFGVIMRAFFMGGK